MKGYRIWLPNERKVIVARDVKFHEATSQEIDKNTEESLEKPEPSTSGIYGPRVDPKKGLKREVSPKLTEDKSTRCTPRSRSGSTSRPTHMRERSRPRIRRTGNRSRLRELHPTKSMSNEDKGLPDIQIEEGDDDVFGENAGFGVDKLNQDSNTGDTSKILSFSGMAEIQWGEALTGNDKQE
uniref:Retroviral polymerase SH3-like domain-containing protein n=1 Tax=Bracon brevicornis TaxID=1563983 RepID=A0A6V7LPA8_9HYME